MAVRPLELARRWHEEGLLNDAALARLKARYPGPEEPSSLTTILLGGAGLVLAAAIIALPFLGEWQPRHVRTYLLVAGAVAGAAGAVWWPRSRWREAAEALALTAAALIIPAAVMFAIDGPTTAAAWLGAAAGAALLAVPSRSALVPVAGLAMLHVLFVVAVAQQLDRHLALAHTLWLVLCLALVGLAFVSGSRPTWRDRHAVNQVVAPLVLAVASIFWWGEALDWHFAGSGEIAVAMWQVPIVVAAVLLRNRRVLMGSVIVVAIDAIVFGFDIGQLYLGIPMLLLVSGGLVGLALWSRRTRQTD